MSANKIKLMLVNALLPFAWSIKFGFGKVTGFWFLKQKFKKQIGYVPNFLNPRSFNEHIQHKKLFVREPSLVTTSDKVQVRNFVTEKLGSKAEQYLIPVLGVYDRPEDIDLNTLPKQFVVKANHGSGTNLIVRNKSELNQEQLIDRCYKWLCRPYGLSSYQWAYTRIQKKIYIEELLLTDDGTIPNDIKLHVIHGKCQFIQVDFERGKNPSRSLYDRDWNLLPFTTRHQQVHQTEKPAQLNEMMAVSETLANEFKYARIDWYVVNGALYLGEITHYPGGGMLPFKPTEYDFKIGEYF